MANKYIINVQDFSPHEITAGGSLAGKYIINTPDFPRPTKVIVAEKLLNLAWLDTFFYTVTDRHI
jgi:hypothetical protein